MIIYSFDSDREFVPFSTPVLDTAPTRNSPMLSSVVVEQSSNAGLAPDLVCESVLAEIASCLSTHEAEEFHLNIYMTLCLMFPFLVYLWHLKI